MLTPPVERAPPLACDYRFHIPGPYDRVPPDAGLLDQFFAWMPDPIPRHGRP